MRASISLQIAAVVILMAGAFFLGRSTVHERQAEHLSSTSPERERQQPLSAITPKVEEEATKTERPAQGIANKPDPQSGSPQDLANAESVSEFLAHALAAAEIDDMFGMAGVIAKWMKQDPDSAIAWLADGERRNDVLRVMLAVWSEDDLETASAWLAANTNLDGFDYAAAGLAYGLANDDQNEAALSLVENIDDRLAKSQVWTEAGSGLYDADPDATLERLANTDFPDELQRAMIKKWKTRLSNKSKRNAQNLASVYSSALAAGAQFQGTSAAEIANELVSGINGSGSFATTRFQIPNLSEIEQTRALENLEFDQGSLNYNPPPEDE